MQLNLRIGQTVTGGIVAACQITRDPAHLSGEQRNLLGMGRSHQKRRDEGCLVQLSLAGKTHHVGKHRFIRPDTATGHAMPHERSEHVAVNRPEQAFERLEMTPKAAA